LAHGPWPGRDAWRAIQAFHVDVMASLLASRTLEPCPVGTIPLSGGPLEDLARQLPTWQMTGVRLERTFACDSFAGAMALANRLLPVVDAADHHPDLLVRWGELRVTLWTHSIGGLHVNDFIVAARIDATLSA
jgi:4a-hydroxytetrahydrobiopterin dehydratase